MGKHSRVAELRAQLKSAGGDVSGRHIRVRWSLPLFATFATLALVSVTLAPPGVASASASVSTSTVVQAPLAGQQPLQSVTVEGEYTPVFARDAFTITAPVPVVVEAPAPAEPKSFGAPAAGTPDPGSAQAIAYGMLQVRGQGEGEYSCLVALWGRESGWNVYAFNASSGAYGIPQSLPGEKMASAGADWATNPATQIAWGLGYIESRYATPCGAWAHSEENGWY